MSGFSIAISAVLVGVIPAFRAQINVEIPTFDISPVCRLTNSNGIFIDLTSSE
ncbi:hypothetical protein D1BOALGB6SA_5925 [Olavius sp. associated proteobacterium Delta 1]|nr:hypothetical protein D1BOALGB6SA_5925 [Olavius sp. associated proteobacterium Delta 1]